MSDILTDTAQKISKEFAKRMEYEVRGAWRAGYDYLHVYDDMNTRTYNGLEDFTICQYVYPSNSDKPIRPDKLRYAYSYDLNSVPDHVIREMIQQQAGIPVDKTDE